MIRIASLLFAGTVVTVFALLLYFYSIGYAGNGGEYWGFDGYIDSRQAARQSFERGDFRFLEVNMRNASGKQNRIVPGTPLCDVHPFGEQEIRRASHSDQIHGPDSVRMATDFARTYNYAMVQLLEEERLAECEVFWDK